MATMQSKILDRAGNPWMLIGGEIDGVCFDGCVPVEVAKLQSDAPNYRPATTEATCATCAHGGDGYCDLYSFNTNNQSTCDSHELLIPRFDKYTPPRPVQVNAAAGVKAYREQLPTALDRGSESLMLLASDIANGRPLDKLQMQTMLDYLTAHYEVASQDSWSTHGAEWQEWNGMGARAGLSWVRRVLRKVGKRNNDLSLEFNMEQSNVSFAGTISKVVVDKQQVFGWANRISKNGEVLIDSQGDMVTADELEKMAYAFVSDTRDLGVMHKAKGMGDLIESLVLTVEKAKAMGIDLPGGHEGWWVGFSVKDPETWARVKKGELREFSIHGKGIRTPVE